MLLYTSTNTNTRSILWIVKFQNLRNTFLLTSSLINLIFIRSLWKCFLTWKCCKCSVIYVNKNNKCLLLLDYIHIEKEVAFESTLKILCLHNIKYFKVHTKETVTVTPVFTVIKTSICAFSDAIYCTILWKNLVL